MKQLFNLLLFTVLCLLVYIVFRSQNTIEGLENNSNTIGIGGGAADYVVRLTNAVTQQTDVLLIEKYTQEVENVCTMYNMKCNLQKDGM